MKNEFTRTLIAFAALSFLANPAIAGASPVVPAVDNQGSEIAKKAYSQIQTCLAPEDSQLNVLFVLDASSSLPEDTDPDGLRGAILAQAISQLRTLSDSREVNIAISSFDLGYSERFPWTTLNSESSSEISSRIPSWVNGWWGQGGGTDWEAALSGGEKSMKESPNSETACKMMIWLTDGGINVDGGWDKGANTQAMEKICGVNPVTGQRIPGDSIVAQLRSEGIHLIGVLLKSQEYLDSIEKTDPEKYIDETSRFSYMLPVTEGSGPVNNAAFSDATATDLNYECGNIPIPEGHAYGALLLGDSPIALAFKFADIANGIRNGQAEDLGSAFPTEFEIEEGINAITIQLAGSSWALTGPSGSVIQSGAEGLQGVFISEEGDLANIRIEGEALPPGTWNLNVEEPLASAVIYREIRVDGLFVPPNPELQSGEESTLTFEFVDGISGDPVPNGVYRPTQLDVLFGPDGDAEQTLNCQQASASLKFECAVMPDFVGKAEIVAELTLSTKSGKIQKTYSGRFSEDAQPSAAFPSVTPTSISLSDLVGQNGTASGMVVLNGPKEGSGEICLPTAEGIIVRSDVVDRQGSYSLVATPGDSDCIALQQGQSVDLSLDIANSVAASGAVELALPFVLKSSDSQQTLTQDVVVRFSSVREGTPNPFVFLALLIIGFGVPIALLYWQARAASKLSLKGLQVANIPVRVEVRGDVIKLSRSPDSSQLFQLNDWEWFSSNIARTRSFVTPSGVTLVAKTPRNPLGSISARAVAPEGSRLITSEGGVTDGSQGGIGLSPANQWILSVPTSEILSSSDSWNGQLVAFANPQGGALEIANRELAMSAQDGMILGGLITIRDRLSASPTTSDVKTSSRKREKIKKVNTVADSSDETQEPNKTPSPFDALFGGAPNSIPNQPSTNSGEGVENKKKPETNNPFENL